MKSVIGCIVLSALCSVALADSIHFEDGRVWYGTVTKLTADHVQIQTRSATQTINLKDEKSYEFDRVALIQLDSDEPFPNPIRISTRISPETMQKLRTQWALQRSTQIKYYDYITTRQQIERSRMIEAQKDFYQKQKQAESFRQATNASELKAVAYTNNSWSSGPRDVLGVVESPGSVTSGSGSYGNGARVYVRGYTKKDGTYVQPHTRSYPK
jgi:hypothetical protein